MFIYKITPNNKTIIINLDVLINGYDDVPHESPIPEKDDSSFIIDPEYFNYIKEEDLENRKPYPVLCNFKLTYVKNAEWFGEKYLEEYDNSKLVLNYDDITNTLKGSYKDEEKVIFKFTFKLEWSDGVKRPINNHANLNYTPNGNFEFYLQKEFDNGIEYIDIAPSDVKIFHRTGWRLKLKAIYCDPNTMFEVHDSDSIEIWLDAYPGDIIESSFITGIYPTILHTWYPEFYFETRYTQPIAYLKNASTQLILTIYFDALPKEYNGYDHIYNYTYEGPTDLFYVNGCDENCNITNSVTFTNLIVEESKRDDDSTMELNEFIDMLSATGGEVSFNTTITDLLINEGNPTSIENAVTSIDINLFYSKSITYNVFPYNTTDKFGRSINVSIIDMSESLGNLFDYENKELYDEQGILSIVNALKSIIKFKKHVPAIDIKMRYEGYVAKTIGFYEQLERIYQSRNEFIEDEEHVENSDEIIEEVNDSDVLEILKSKNINDKNIVYGTHTTLHKNTYSLTLTYRTIGQFINSTKATSELNKFSRFINKNLRINGEKTGLNSSYIPNESKTFNNSVYPGIYSISVDEMPESIEGIMDIEISGVKGQLLFTNDENEKHITTYKHISKDINTPVDSYMLLRTNPKLTGNVKLVVDTKNNLYIDTFKISNELSKKIYRKYPISYEGNYPRDIRNVFGNILLQELFRVPELSLDPKRYYTDFKELYLTMYEYGAETNDDNMYEENMKILAPLHIGKRIPEFFAIFRYEGTYNPESANNKPLNNTKKFVDLLKDSELVKTYDLRTFTAIGQYLNNYKDMLKDYIYGQTYLLFIELDNEEYSNFYRLGKNTWKGILIDKGILGNKSEISYAISKELNKKEKDIQETLNNYIIDGFERNHIIYPNILNLEFMFNDESQENYSQHRYFGLYLSENDIVSYDSIIKDNPIKNETILQLDVSGNIVDDKSIVSLIDSKKFADRIFYAITNDSAKRVKTKKDIVNFKNNFVLNKPLDNISNVYAEPIKFENNIKSFITLSFKEPIKPGEHFKFIALNIHKNNKGINSSSNYTNSDKLNILFEIVASDDSRLLDAEDYVYPYVSTLINEFADNTQCYRISFYTNDVNYNDYLADLEEQLRRFRKAIKKIDSFISVGSHNDTTISIISEYDEMYFQHIDALKLNEIQFDITNITGYSTDEKSKLNKIKYYTLFNDSSTYVYFENNTSINDSSNTNIIEEGNQENNIQENEDLNLEEGILSYTGLYSVDESEISSDPEATNEEPIQEEPTQEDNSSNLDNNSLKPYYQYATFSETKNIKEDSISYFHKNIKSYMKPLSNETRLFDLYYQAFSLNNFEMLGWRFLNIVKFIKTEDLNYIYRVREDIEPYLKDVQFPLVHTKSKGYLILDKIDINIGYINCKISESDPTSLKIVFDNFERHTIINPFDVNDNMINSYYEVSLNNFNISLYKPKWMELAIMGITNIKDIDTTIDLNREINVKSELDVTFTKGEKVPINDTDYRIQQGVVYKLISGGFDNAPKLNEGEVFIIIGNIMYIGGNVNEKENIRSEYLTALGNNTTIRINDKQKYLDYNLKTSIPTQNSSYFFINDSLLRIPIVPSTNCLWDSNGTYLDLNSTLDTSKLIYNYLPEGCYTENTYVPGEFKPNQYVTNKIEDLVVIDGKSMQFEEAILNNKSEHIIKEMLISSSNIKPAIGYYNANIETFEFVFNGAKFVMKVSKEYYQLNIHLNDYNNFEVFVLNDYDLSKNNKVYISTVEEFILIINHTFYIDYAREGDNNIKEIANGTIKPYVKYSTNYAPYELNINTLSKTSNSLSANRTTMFKSLFDMIDPLNMWSSYFVQYDIPNKGSLLNSNSFFLYNNLTTWLEYQQKIGMINIDDAESSHSRIQYNTGMSKDSFTISKLTENTGSQLNNVFETEPYSYIITKADGDYNTAKESPRIKLKRYANSFDVDTDYYIISENSYEEINVTKDYKAIELDVTIPNKMKYNFGYFVPRTIDIVEFNLRDEELSKKLGINLLLANTNVKKVNNIPTYTGNKVFKSLRGTVTKNYFIKKDHSPLSSNWDPNFYRLYTSENKFTYYPGYITGIDDKSFFGSRCMVLKNDNILITDWNPLNNTNIISSKESDSTYNMKCVNIEGTIIRINVTLALYNFFINNEKFMTGWDNQYVSSSVSVKKYVDMTISKFYNIASNMELTLYKKDNYNDNIINIRETKPSDLANWSILESFESSFETNENELYIVIKIDDLSNIEIYPTLKIFKK